MTFNLPWPRIEITCFISAGYNTGHLKVKRFVCRFKYLISEKRLESPVGRSLFTGLRAQSHFCRPNFVDLFDIIQTENTNVGNIGVFRWVKWPFLTSTSLKCRGIEWVDLKWLRIGRKWLNYDYYEIFRQSKYFVT